jgi:alginate O-acetyltransferase complex protein AlgI
LSFTMATLFFAIQIYCDFSGYTDIARGLSKTMGVELMLNFNYPYHAATVGEFWRRWHISLSTWFRDYVYMPLGGSNRSQVITYRNVLIVFLISGLWHGASWHYVAWGLLHGLVLLTERLANKYQLVLNKTWGSIKTFSIIIVSWSLFRINDLQDFKKISFHNLHISSEQFGWCYLIYALILIGIILFAEKKIVTSFLQLNNTKKVMAIIITTILIFIFGLFNNNQFIYFQF